MSSGNIIDPLCVKDNQTDGLGNIITNEFEPDETGNCSQNSVSTDAGPLQENMYCQPIESPPLAILSGLLATATITANMLVILAILRGSSRFHRPIYWLIIHLSVADLFVGIMLLWNYCLAYIFNIHNTMTSLMVVFCIWVTSESASTLGFVLLAVDRYLQIFYKNFHRTYATRVTVGTAIFLAWAVPFCVFSVPPMIFGHSCGDKCVCIADKYMQCLPRTECSQILPPFQKSYTLAVALMLLICIPIPITIYTMIFIRVRKTTHIVRQKHKRHDMRLIKTLVVILAVFIVSLSPVAFLVLTDYIVTWENDTMIDVAFYIFVLAFSNSLANPFLYMWRMSAIRRSIRQRVLCFCNKKSNNVSSRREITSFQSEQRSPTSNRHDVGGPEETIKRKYAQNNNNNVPLAAMLCLRQIKRGRYTNSRTSTPLSERANNIQFQEETQKFTNHIDVGNLENGDNIPNDEPNHNSCREKIDCEITEL